MQKNNYSCGEISRKARTISILETKPINRPFFVINNASSVVNNSLASETRPTGEPLLKITGNCETTTNQIAVFFRCY